MKRRMDSNDNEQRELSKEHTEIAQNLYLMSNKKECLLMLLLFMMV
jgi:hypothetical protein